MAQPQTAPRTDDVRLDGVRVLLVEDNRTNQLVVKKMLERRGAVVRLAANGQEGVDAYAPGDVDLVLMDLSMPVMTGIEAAKRIRARQSRERWPHRPILALTGNAFDSDREEALAAGMDGFLTKPVRIADLMTAFARHLPASQAAE